MVKVLPMFFSDWSSLPSHDIILLPLPALAVKYGIVCPKILSQAHVCPKILSRALACPEILSQALFCPEILSRVHVCPGILSRALVFQGTLNQAPVCPRTLNLEHVWLVVVIHLQAAQEVPRTACLGILTPV